MKITVFLLNSWQYKVINNTSKITGQEQPLDAGCAAAAKSFSYDANGNISSKTDFNGMVTNYTYDLTRNLETQRVEAVGAPHARTITTTWYATYNVPLQVVEPKRLTRNSYDISGSSIKLIYKKVWATTDETGAQGIAASVIEPPRSKIATVTINAIKWNIT